MPGLRTLIALFFIAGAGVSSLAALFGLTAWPFDVAASFLVPSFAVSLILAGVMLARRHFVVASVSAAVAAAAGVTLAPFASDIPLPLTPRVGTTIVHVAHANLFLNGAAAERLSAWPAARDADVISLTELPKDVAAVKSVFRDHPYWLESKTPGRRKAALFSRTPLRLVSDTGGVLVADTEIGNAAIRIITLHPPPPLTPGAANWRNGEIKQAMAEGAMDDGPAVVVGDFNATPWSPVLNRAAHSVKFHRVSGGVWRSTWLTRFPLFGLTLDNIYVSQDVERRGVRVGPFIGSDHRPISAEIAVENTSGAAE